MGGEEEFGISGEAPQGGRGHNELGQILSMGSKQLNSGGRPISSLPIRLMATCNAWGNEHVKSARWPTRREGEKRVGSQPRSKIGRY